MDLSLSQIYTNFEPFRWVFIHNPKTSQFDKQLNLFYADSSGINARVLIIDGNVKLSPSGLQSYMWWSCVVLLLFNAFVIDINCIFTGGKILPPYKQIIIFRNSLKQYNKMYDMQLFNPCTQPDTATACLK